MTDETLIAYLLRNSEILNSSNIIFDALRSVGWFLLKLLIRIADACRALYDFTFGLIDFTTWTKINTFVSEFKPLIVALTCLSIFALGIILMVKHEKKPNILIHILLATLCLTGSTAMFQELNDFTLTVKGGIESMSSGGTASSVYNIASDYFYDLYYYDQSENYDLGDLNYKEKPGKIPQYKLNKQKLGAIHINDKLDPGSKAYKFEDPDAKDILTQRLFMDGDGEYTLLPLEDGFAWTDVGSEYYYRYKVDWLAVVVEICAIIFVYICMAWKCTKIVYELVFARCLAALYSAEFSGGQKLGKILIFIRDSYILMLMTTLSLKLFYFFNAFIHGKTDNDLVAVIVTIFVAFAVIDGPNLVEQLLGMDVGLQSSLSRVVAAYGIARGASSIATAPARAGASWYMQKRRDDKLADKIGQSTGKGSGVTAPAGTGSPNLDTSFMDRSGKPSADGSEGSKTNNDAMSAGEKNMQKGEPAAAYTGAEKDTAGAVFMDSESGRVEKGDENGSAAEHGRANLDTSFMDSKAGETGMYVSGEHRNEAGEGGTIQDASQTGRGQEKAQNEDKNYGKTAKPAGDTDGIGSPAGKRQISKSATAAGLAAGAAAGLAAGSVKPAAGVSVSAPNPETNHLQKKNGTGQGQFAGSSGMSTAVSAGQSNQNLSDHDSKYKITQDASAGTENGIRDNLKPGGTNEAFMQTSDQGGAESWSESASGTESMPAASGDTLFMDKNGVGQADGHENGLQGSTADNHALHAGQVYKDGADAMKEEAAGGRIIAEPKGFPLGKDTESRTESSDKVSVSKEKQTEASKNEFSFMSQPKENAKIRRGRPGRKTKMEGSILDRNMSKKDGGRKR